MEVEMSDDEEFARSFDSGFCGRKNKPRRPHNLFDALEEVPAVKEIQMRPEQTTIPRRQGRQDWLGSYFS